MEEVYQHGTIGSVPIADIAGEFGTPLYVYDAEYIRRQYRQLKEAFSGYGIKIHYAAKACTNLHILDLLRKEGSGLDTVSLNEARFGLLAGFRPEDILYTPSSISMEEVSAAVEMGIHVVIDNLELLRQFGERYGSSVPCSIRLNPDILAGGHARIQVGHKESKFGIPVFQLDEIRETVKARQITVSGLHCHVGSEISGSEPFLKVLDLLLDAAQGFPSLQFVDFGSGFKVPYFRNQPEEDIATLGKAISERMHAYKATSGRSLELYCEPGKYLVAEAGIFITKAQSLKPIHNQTIVGLNSGFNHLLRPMFYDAFHEIVNISNLSGEMKEYTLVGYICETDFFARNRELNEIRPKDLIVFCTAGAYGFSMSSNYNAHGRPAEVLVDKGKAILVRRSEQFEDLLLTQEGLFRPQTANIPATPAV